MAPPIVRRASKTPLRSTRTKPVSYAESSSDSNSESSVETEGSAAPVPRERRRPRHTSTTQVVINHTPRKQPRVRARARTSPHRTYESDDSDHQPSKKIKRSRPHTIKSGATRSFTELQASEVIPSWHTLPYHILVQIFEYATFPLYDERNFQSLPSGRWLLDVAYLCRAFAEPALTVLYKSPPLVPMVQAHRLVDLLEQDPTKLAYRYRQKVKSLRIDVGQVAAYSLPGRGLLDLHNLIKDLPQLDDLEFYHQNDMSPYRNLDNSIKWTYPDSLFAALEYVDPQGDVNRGDKTQIRPLQSWRWSSRLAGKKWPLEKIPEMHAKPFFASLKKIAFVNYQTPPPPKNDDEEEPRHEQILAKALGMLPNLKHLIFESSTLMNSELLPLLPKNLRNLELINCWDVSPDDFAAFLLTHGHHLRVLTLNHNQSLSLAFLPVLGLGCPNLQVFRMNLTFYNLHATYHDSKPIYEQLLTIDQIPVWPSKLQIIELTQLRKWETDAAEMFFQSLLDSAGDLRDLRRLSIQAILNIGWRDRATFRDKWVGSLTRVFKREIQPPQSISSLPKLSRPVQDFPLPSHDVEEVATISKDAVVSEKHSALRSRDFNVVLNRNITAPAQQSIPLHKEGPSPPRRSARSTKSLPTGGYAESSDSSGPEDVEYTEAEPENQAHSDKPTRRGALQRELSILKETAGADSPDNRSSPKLRPADSSGDDQAIGPKASRMGKQHEIIQGMCNVVEVRIDNLRPMENQFTADDFLGPPESDDEEWNGDNDDKVSYAW
jgi:hypothetical protein